VSFAPEPPEPDDVVDYLPMEETLRGSLSTTQLESLRNLARSVSAGESPGCFSVCMPLSAGDAAAVKSDPVVEQSILHKSTRPWCLITNPEVPLDAVKQYVQNNKEQIIALKDPAGANVLHIALLFGNLPLADYLVDECKDALVNRVYTFLCPRNPRFLQKGSLSLWACSPSFSAGIRTGFVVPVLKYEQPVCLSAGIQLGSSWGLPVRRGSRTPHGD